jgi:hypothetical protein
MRRFIGIVPEDVEQTLAQSLPQAGDDTAQATAVLTRSGMSYPRLSNSPLTVET